MARTAKPKPPPTPEEQKQKALKELNVLKNTMLSQYNFKRIRTKFDLLVYAGYAPSSLAPDDTPVTRDDIIHFIAEKQHEIEKKYQEQTASTSDSLSVSLPSVDNKEIPVQDTTVVTDSLPKTVSVLSDATSSYYISNPCSVDTIQAIKEGKVEINSKLFEQIALSAWNKLPASPKQKVRLLTQAGDGVNQVLAAAKIYYKFVHLKHRADLLNAQTGAGKTYIIAGVLRKLLDTGFLEGKTISPWPIVWVTKAPIVEQMERVLKNEFGIDIVNEVKVINIEQLRATFGEMFLKEETVVSEGEARVVLKWKPVLHFCVGVWDECQILKNENSQQSKIGQAFNDIDTTEETYQLFSSATPFTTVAEARCFAVATRLKFSLGVAQDQPLSNIHWHQFARSVAYPAAPEEHSPAAMERLMEYLVDYVTDVKGIRPKHKPINKVQICNFDTPEDAMFYAGAIARFQQEKARIEAEFGSEGGQAGICILVELLKLRQAAELIHVSHIAREAYEDVIKYGKASLIACNFKQTIRKLVKVLYYDYNISREQISLVWGGGTESDEKNDKKKKLDKKRKKNEALRKTEDAIKQYLGVDVAEELNLEELMEKVDAEENKYLPESYRNKYPENDLVDKELLRLGKQSKKERQREIDKYQSGQSLWCIYTFKSGGVGLSLHHVSMHNGKSVVNRPRRTRLLPTYSAVELVQGLGRGPRVTSESDTEQFLAFFKDTVEEKVARRVSVKLKCLKKVVRQKESWEDIIIGGNADATADDERHIKGKKPSILAQAEADEPESEGITESIDPCLMGEDDIEDEDDDI